MLQSDPIMYITLHVNYGFIANQAPKPTFTCKVFYITSTYIKPNRPYMLEFQPFQEEACGFGKITKF